MFVIEMLSYAKHNNVNSNLIPLKHTDLNV